MQRAESGEKMTHDRLFFFGGGVHILQSSGLTLDCSVITLGEAWGMLCGAGDQTQSRHMKN